MIAVIKKGTTENQLKGLTDWLCAQGLDVHISKGSTHTIVGLVGDTSRIDAELIESLEIVESVKRISEPFKSANRKFHPDDTVISVGNTSVGGDIFTLIAGPCSVESEEQVMDIARSVKAAGATMLRGPAPLPTTFRDLKQMALRSCSPQKRRQVFPSLPR